MFLHTALNLLVYLIGQLLFCSLFVKGLATIPLVKQGSQQPLHTLMSSPFSPTPLSSSRSRACRPPARRGSDLIAERCQWVFFPRT